MLHSELDERLDSDQLRDMLRELDADDGEVIEITIKKTGRKPHEGKRWKLISPHVYGPVTCD